MARESVVGRLALASRPFACWALYAVFFAAHVWLRSLGDDWLAWRSLAGAERFVFLGHLPSNVLQSPGDTPLWADLVAFGTHLSWFFVPIVVGVVLTATRRPLLMEYFVWLLVTFFVADVCFLLVPVIPPWMDGSASRILLERQFINYTGVDSNPVASLPSLHAALPLVIALFLGWRAEARGWSLAVGGYSAMVGVAVVYLGEHWALDVLGGYALAGVIAFSFLHSKPRSVARSLPGDPVGRIVRLNERVFPEKSPDVLRSESEDLRPAA